MPPSVVVVIYADPLKTHRAVEALRIALGLSTGDNPLTIVLLDRAPLLLTDDLSDVLDVEVLEKYLPSLKQLKIPFILPLGTRLQFQLDSGFEVREASTDDIESLISSTDRVLVF